ncbi:MAG TPA: BPSS1780 family membrane protein [Trinickia sp.]|nr:BPSS1780 family membrane protein [Trinickia sp.]
MNIGYLSGSSNGIRRRCTPELRYPEGREVSAAAVADWLASGWQAARMQPLLWLAVILGCADFATLLKLLPMYRPFAVLLAPLVAGVLMLAQDRARDGEPARLGQLVAAVVERRNALLAIGLYSAAIVLAGYAILFTALHVSMTAAAMANGSHGLLITYDGGHGARSVLESMVGVPIFAAALAAAWFAPALVMLHDITPLEAIAASFKGVARNWQMALVYFVAMTLTVWLAPMIPLLAYALVVTPVLAALMLLSMYGGYRDVFVGR